MIKLLLSIVVISLFCNGVYLLFNFGNVLDFVRKWWIDISGGIERADSTIRWASYSNGEPIHSVKVFLYKPLFGCITCMSSIWGSLAYWTIVLPDIASLILWPIVIVSCACMNLLINRIYE